MVNKPNPNPQYIVIEGAEGSGKSTQVERLAQYLTDQGILTKVVREPGSTPAGEAIRNLNQHSKFDLDPKTGLLLVYAARVELLNYISQLTKSGQWVISDRNYLSTYAYQGYGQGMDISTIDQVHRAVMPDNLVPDHTFVIDTSFATNQARLGSQAAELDR
ncbi:dTMP kinase, partial [Candidatus Saccharibacteria bacterium]|nr:dTMP kinase [Candidatus Saccharibacteria bacterium]